MTKALRDDKPGQLLTMLLEGKVNVKKIAYMFGLIPNTIYRYKEERWPLFFWKENHWKKSRARRKPQDD
jgi:hypothetical protein